MVDIVRRISDEEDEKYRQALITASLKAHEMRRLYFDRQTDSWRAVLRALIAIQLLGLFLCLLLYFGII